MYTYTYVCMCIIIYTDMHIYKYIYINIYVQRKYHAASFVAEKVYALMCVYTCKKNLRCISNTYVVSVILICIVCDLNIRTDNIRVRRFPRFYRLSCLLFAKMVRVITRRYDRRQNDLLISRFG